MDRDGLGMPPGEDGSLTLGVPLHPAGKPSRLERCSGLLRPGGSSGPECRPPFRESAFCRCGRASSPQLMCLDPSVFSHCVCEIVIHVFKDVSSGSVQRGCAASCGRAPGVLAEGGRAARRPAPLESHSGTGPCGDFHAAHAVFSSFPVRLMQAGCQ